MLNYKSSRVLIIIWAFQTFPMKLQHHFSFLFIHVFLKMDEMESTVKIADFNILGYLFATLGCWDFVLN